MSISVRPAIERTSTLASECAAFSLNQTEVRNEVINNSADQHHSGYGSSVDFAAMPPPASCVSSIVAICGAEAGVRALCMLEPSSGANVSHDDARLLAEQAAKVRQAMKIEINQALDADVSKWLFDHAAPLV